MMTEQEQDDEAMEALRELYRLFPPGWASSGKSGQIIAFLAVVTICMRAAGLINTVLAVLTGFVLVLGFVVVAFNWKWHKILKAADSGPLDIPGNAVWVGDTVKHVGACLHVDDQHIIVRIEDVPVLDLSTGSSYRILAKRGKPLGNWVLLSDSSGKQLGFFLAPTPRQFSKKLAQFGWGCRVG